jgi:hypothetical protein
MNSIPDLTLDPATWHPSWCSRDHCTAPDRLAARGVAEVDVPLHQHHAHLSVPISTGKADREDSIVTLQAERFVDQPPAAPGSAGVDAVVLTVEHKVVGTKVVATLEAAQLDALAVALTDMRALVAGRLQ